MKELNRLFATLVIACLVNVFALANNNSVTSPTIPSKMTFADTEISFDREDMYERMDRELTSLVFGHSSTMLAIKRANKYYNVIVPILKRNGVPTDFFYLVATESIFDERAYSGAKAAGLWQFLAATGRQFGLEVNDDVDERYNVEKATEAACKYLKQGYKKYGCWLTVASSYNAGMARIASELSKQDADNAFDLYLNKETSRYIFRIMAYKLVIENYDKYGFRIAKNQLYYAPKCKDVVVDTAVGDWVAWAKNHGISYAQLREANQWIRSTSLPNKTGKRYVVKVPVKKELYRSSQTKTVAKLFDK